MDLAEETKTKIKLIADPMCWENLEPDQLMDIEKYVIDFANINDDFNQAKFTLMISQIAKYGLTCLMHKVEEKLNPLYHKQLRLSKSEEKRGELDKINSNIAKLVAEDLTYLKELDEITINALSIEKKFWGHYFKQESEESEEESEESEEESEESEQKSEEESEQESDEEFKEKGIIGNSIMDGSLEQLENYLVMENLIKHDPSDDLDDIYGWKTFCDIKRELEHERITKRKEYIRSKENQNQMEITNNEQDTLSGPGDCGTDLKENSLSLPHEKNTDSKNSSACTLNRSDLAKLLQINAKYRLKVNKALLMFCEKYLPEPPEYLSRGLNYVRDQPA